VDLRGESDWFDTHDVVLDVATAGLGTIRIDVVIILPWKALVLYDTSIFQGILGRVCLLVDTDACTIEV